MSKKQKGWVVSLSILAIFGIPFLLKLPAFWWGFDYSKANNLGTAISGLTAPVLSLISIILIFMAFDKQTEANEILKEQNKDLKEQGDEIKSQTKIDFILKLLDQLYVELGAVIYMKPGGGVPPTGSEAVMYIGKDFDLFTKRGNPSNFNNVRKVIGIANSFHLIEDVIITSNLPSEMKDILQKKLSSWFSANLANPFDKFRQKHRKNPSGFDSESMIIVELVEKYWPEE